MNTPIYMHRNLVDQPEAMAANPAIFEYRHLTTHFFRGINQYDQKRFRNEFIDDDAVRFQRMTNHPDRYVSLILDLEQHNIGQTNNPNWERYAEEYRNMCRMMKATGNEVAVYGIQPESGFFQACWNLIRYQWRLQRNPNDAKAELRTEINQEKQEAQEDKFRGVMRYFDPEVDAFIAGLYCPYQIDEAWEMQAWMYYANQMLELMSESGKPVYAFIQPSVSYRPRGEALKLEAFESMVRYLDALDTCHRIYVFSNEDWQQEPNWTGVFSESNNNPEGTTA